LLGRRFPRAQAGEALDVLPTNGGTTHVAKQLQFPVVRLVFLARYQVLLGLLLVSLAPVAVWVEPELLHNLLVLNRPIQLFNVTWIVMLTAALVLVAFRITQLNAGERFGVVLPAWAAARGGWRLRWLVWLGLGLMVPIFCAILTARDPDPDGWPTSDVPVGAIAALMVLVGTGFALLILLFLTGLQQYLLYPRLQADHLLPGESWSFFQRMKAIRIDWIYRLSDVLARWLERFGPGYVRTVKDLDSDKPRQLLAPGHAQAFLWFTLALLAYVLGYVIGYRGNVPDETSAFPTLFYAFQIMILFGSLLAGMAFFLEYDAVPVRVVVLVFSVASYWLGGVDHFYELNPPSSTNSPAIDLKLTDVAQRWHPPAVVPETTEGAKRAKRTLVVVTAAG